MAGLLGLLLLESIDMVTELLPQRCSKSELRFLFREGDTLLSPLALTKTLQACTLDSQAEDYSLEEIPRFAFARTMRVIEGWSYEEILQGFESGKYFPDRVSYESVQQIADRFREELSRRKSKVDLFREHNVSLDTVSATFWAIGVPTKRRLYSPEDCSAFADARSLLENLGLTYFQLRTHFNDKLNLEENLEACQQKRYCKRELADIFRLSVRTVKRTLRACDLSTRQRSYSSLEFLRFEKARQLIELEGKNYDQVSQILAV